MAFAPCSPIASTTGPPASAVAHGEGSAAGAGEESPAGAGEEPPAGAVVPPQPARNAVTSNAREAEFIRIEPRDDPMGSQQADRPLFADFDGA